MLPRHRFRGCASARTLPGGAPSGPASRGLRAHKEHNGSGWGRFPPISVPPERRPLCGRLSV